MGYFVDVIYDVNDSGVVQTQSMWKYILQTHLFRKDRQSCGFRLGKAGFLFWLRHSGNVTQPLFGLSSQLQSSESTISYTCHEEKRNLSMKTWLYKISKSFYRSSHILIICLKILLWLLIIQNSALLTLWRCENSGQNKTY